MKNKNIITLLAIVLTAVSCDLNKSPLSSLSPEQFFSSATELEAFSNQFYMDLPGTSVYEEESDMLIKDGLTLEMRGGRTVPSSGSGWTFTSLRDYNTLLDYSINCEDEVVRTKYNALARFFRANFYFEKVKRFGDVPWYGTQLGSADPGLYKPRDSREYVMDRIIEDLDFAIENLPATRSLYTVTKWTALALKSRVCLFEGTFRKYHAGHVTLKTLPSDAKSYEYYLTLAAEAGEEFIVNSGYSLHTADGKSLSYLMLFANENAIDTEIILARDYDAGLGLNHNGTYYTLGNYGNPSMTRKMACTYLMSDGSRFTDKAGWQTMEFVDEVKNRDPRMAQTIRVGNYKRLNSETVEAPNFAQTITGYQPIKYMQGKAAEGGIDVDKYGASYNDLPIFRAAEVYLNFAEAKAELGTLTQSDLTISVNKIRDRVGMPHLNMATANANPDPYLLAEETGYPNVSGANQGVILEIRRERSVELFDENFRYYDLVRWKNGQAYKHKYLGIYIPKVNEYYDLNGDGKDDLYIYNTGEASSKAGVVSRKIGEDIYLTGDDKGYVWTNTRTPGLWEENKDYYYPIPINDRSLTNGALTQNNGWDDGLTF